MKSTIKPIELTTKALSRVKTPPIGRIEVRIKDHRGLSLLVGQNSWSWLLRHERRGVRQTLKLYDYVEGADLRQVAADATAALAQMSAGIDLAAQRRKERHSMTVGELASEFLTRHTAKPRTMAEYERQLDHDVLPQWQSRKAADIESDDVIALFDGIVDRGSKTLANRVHSMLGKMFQFALQRKRQTGVKVNPVRGLSKPGGKEEGRTRRLSDDEIRTLWTALDAMPEHIRALYVFLLTTGQRVTEAMSLPFGEIDRDRMLWVLPPSRSKNGREHVLPLVGRAAALLRLRFEQRGEHAYVFPGRRRGKPLSSINKAHAAIVKACGFSFQLRDLRRTCASGLAEAGASRFIVKMILNHVDGDGATPIYDRHNYWVEMKAALERWDRALNRIIEPELQTSNVVSMRA
jgi:integrase